MKPIVLRPLLIAGLILTIAQTTSAAKPNFIVINIDDLGYGDIEPFGCDHQKTPHLNRMASEGRKLTSFYAAPVCSPSRASLMTGCYPKRALPIQHVFFPGQPGGLHPDEITVAELLKEQGYSTGIIGKWHLGDQPDFLPTRQGFDYYFGLPYSNDMGPAKDGVKSNLDAPIPVLKDRQGRPRRGQPPLPLMQNEEVLQRVLAIDQRELVTNYTQQAVRYIETHKDGPFFLYLPHSAVHFPLYPGKKFVGKSDNGLFGDWTQEVDWSVGQVLDTVRRLGLETNTLVLFTSDNGGQERHGADNGPLRGGKGTTFEGGMRVPTIAWWPGKIPAASESDAVMCTMDLLPTLVGLAGGKAPQDRKIDGGDIWPLLSGDPAGTTPHETFLFYRGHKLQAVRHGDFKLILESNELYDLNSDLGETTNVAQQHPEVVAEIESMMGAIDADLGLTKVGPGCRPLGHVEDPQPLIPFDQPAGVIE